MSGERYAANLFVMEKTQINKLIRKFGPIQEIGPKQMSTTFTCYRSRGLNKELFVYVGFVIKRLVYDIFEQRYEPPY